MSYDDNEAWLIAQPEPDLTDAYNPEWTDEDFARAIPADRLPPKILAAFPKIKLGRPKSPAPKVAVKLRIDPDVLGAYKATGPAGRHGSTRRCGSRCQVEPYEIENG